MKESDIPDIFGREGSLSSVLPGYEERPQQGVMAGEVLNALSSQTHLVAEAGTGIGKSLAYLAPAALFSVTTGKQVILSTKTLNLQDQLIHKDIPALHECLDTPFVAEVLKGRANYLCLRRAEYASEFRDSLFESRAEQEDLSKVLEWGRHASTGTRDEMEYVPAPSVWSRVQCESSACRGKKCRYYERCFYQTAKKKILKADLIVVNHSLYFSDLAVRTSAGTDAGVLPVHGYVVFDEAHSVEEIASNHIGSRISNFQVAYVLRELYNPEKEKGILQMYGTDDVRKMCGEAAAAADLFFANVKKEAEQNSEKGENIWELEPDRKTGDVLSPFLSDLAGGIRDFLRLIEDNDGISTDVKLELGLIHDRLLECADSIALFETREAESTYARWVEFGGGASGRIVSLNRVPLDISDFLSECLFDTKDSVIMTGATLGAGQDNGFEYFASKTGLETYRGIKLDSPYDFRKNVVLHLARSLPTPKNDAYRDAALDTLKKVIPSVSGGIMVLFTSYSMMNDFAQDMHEVISRTGRRLFVQGRDKSRTMTLQEFKEAGNGVLFGTSSFWTGVDVRGESLSNVILMRLPFSVPSHPVIRGKCRLIRERGGDPFREFIMPEAVLIFRQGIGRLLRSKTDRGNIMVFDSRIVHAGYGRFFLQAVPQCTIEYF